MSRTIYINHGPVRYFFWLQVVGVKNPRYLTLFYRESEEDEGRVSSWLDDSKYARDFVCFQHMWLFLYIIFVSYSYNKACKLVEWLARCSVSVGTWVRFPGPPKTHYVIFLHVFACRLPREFHHMPSNIHVSCVHSHKSNGHEKLTMVFPVNAYLDNSGKSTKAWA